ncbi:hypothetical protein ACPPVQ_09325 [Diaminobutyricibacter sp. McL0618]|uniref:hypothetical protein n=1 Tax=Leifsonia sp. McL0618 TaxID=3415677 RepID=UPI003CF00E9D
MKIIVTAAAVCALVVLLTGCTAGTSSDVPHLGGGSSHAAGSGHVQPDKLHAAADCIRSHGVPGYQDPVVDSSGHVYTDSRSIQNLSDAQGQAIEQACSSLITAAGFSPADEAPAPPALVAAGVKAAQCLRANGLPDYRDPKSSTAFTPGHGFGLTADEIPNNGALGKKDPSLQRAFTACRKLLDAEVRASSLSALAHG